MLRLLIDESTGRAVADFLRQAGHDVVHVSDLMPQSPDRDILETAMREARIVVTNDKDFGELVFKSQAAHAGIILFRLDDESAAHRVLMARTLFEKHESALAGHFTVVTETVIRIRRCL